MRTKKEMEFLRLQQGSMTVGEYASKFDDLARYAPHYNQIPDFATLVNKCRLYEESMKARNAALKSGVPPGNSYGPQRNFGQGIGRGKPFNRNQKPYASPSGNNNSNTNNTNNKISSPVGNSNLNTPPWCSKCKGKHVSVNYPVCYHCNQPGHIKPMCPKLKREEVNNGQVTRPKAKGRVFTMSGTEIEGNEDLIQGTCRITEISLSVLFDPGATHSFISNDVANR
ncbi:PREDICTED: uncharacterized protein LOC109339076 [Lupinus angustifolius]|uniref:uncharacterized protein LOC109339076 n=1 Tax=Lupinus angustifolius TaxID=3871 RepID=UPI00092F402F|nr:PREDICTED: uncharacterized protein LOC109339076 [Lupinus angustifolius]